VTLNTYLYLYSGRSKPASKEIARAQLGEWMRYFSHLGHSVIDMGAPFTAKSLCLGGAAASRATGFSLIAAGDLDAARALTEGHPHLRNGGGIEVFECVTMRRTF
jgi:hypothetical protein